MVAIPGKNWRERNVFNLFYCVCLKLVCITELPLRCDSYYMLQIKDVSGIVSNWHAIPCKKCEDLTAPIYPISQWYMIPLGNKIACLYYTSWVTPSHFQTGTTHEALLLQLELIIPQPFCVHVSENKDMHNSHNMECEFNERELWFIDLSWAAIGTFHSPPPELLQGGFDVM